MKLVFFKWRNNVFSHSIFNLQFNFFNLCFCFFLLIKVTFLGILNLIKYNNQSKQYNLKNFSKKNYLSLLEKKTKIKIEKIKFKIEKALAATGYQNSTEAINWIMKHSKDALLNQDSVIATRDYILVICPVGRLATQITTFLHQSRLKCSNNEAHFNNLLPFMKLTPFFKVLLYF